MNKQPEQLINFYNSLEKLRTFDLWQIHNQLSTCVGLEEEWRDKLITERKVLHHSLSEGQLLVQGQSPNIKGEVKDSFSFSKDEITYLKERTEQTSNHWLKARYSNVIWLVTKHNTYAELAIDSYISSLISAQPDQARDFVKMVSAFIYLSKKTKIKCEEVKEVLFEIIEVVPEWMKARISSAALSNNFFDKTELRTIADEIDSWIDVSNKGSYHTNLQTINLAIEICRKINRSTSTYFELLAKNEDLIIEQHPEDDDFVKFTAVGKKVQFLSKSDNQAELDKVLAEYTRLKQFVKLNKVSVELEDDKLQMFNDYLDIRCDAILEQDSDSILAYFALHECILVDPIQTQENASKSVRSSIRNIFTISQLDINTNFKNLTESQKIESEYISQYALAHGLNFTSIFNKVFVEGIISGKLNYFKIYSFLEDHTWYGYKFTRRIKDEGLESDASWLSLIAPGLHSMFSQFELAVLMNDSKVNNFVLCIDSLALKFEGALRDFIRLNNGSTTKDKKGELQEQLLEELLDNPITKKFFTERDIGLFEYTFTRKGKNLRNNVAHSFMSYSDYNLNLASLVFLCILRLGKYDIKSDSNQKKS